MLKRLTLIAAILFVGGCTKISGTVYDSMTRRPVPGAVFTLGHPGGVSGVERFTTDAYGHFAFQVPGIDENRVFVYDGKQPLSAQRIDRSELGPNMKVYITKGAE
jgi:hypothetical protein